MSQSKDTKGQVVATAKQLIAGATKHFSNTTPVVFGGSSFTLDQITSKLQMLVDLRADANAAKAVATEKIAVENAQTPALAAFMKQLTAFVEATYFHSASTMTDFGITPKAPIATTSETKAAAAVKRKATRAARHTMGSRQKASVKGDVTSIVITPVKSTTATVPTQDGPTAPATSGSPTATTTQHNA
jgi:hypothetical protein